MIHKGQYPDHPCMSDITPCELCTFGSVHGECYGAMHECLAVDRIIRSEIRIMKLEEKVVKIR